MIIMQILRCGLFLFKGLKSEMERGGDLQGRVWRRGEIEGMTNKGVLFIASLVERISQNAREN